MGTRTPLSAPLSSPRFLKPAAASVEELRARVAAGYGTTSSHLQGRASAARRELVRRGFDA